MGDIYTFGPTFRAENSNTSRHLAEFWMIEPEMAFADLEDNMACSEAYLKHCVAHILQHCHEDLQFFDDRYEKGLIQRLQVCSLFSGYKLRFLKSRFACLRRHLDSKVQDCAPQKGKMADLIDHESLQCCRMWWTSHLQP